MKCQDAKDQDIFKMARDAKGNAKKDVVFYAKMGQLNAYNRYVDKLFEDHEKKTSSGTFRNCSSFKVIKLQER